MFSWAFESRDTINIRKSQFLNSDNGFWMSCHPGEEKKDNRKEFYINEKEVAVAVALSLHDSGNYCSVAKHSSKCLGLRVIPVAEGTEIEGQGL